MPDGQDTLWVRMKAIMEDTLVIAQLVISSNDVLDPEVIIPVNFTMLGNTTGNEEPAMGNSSDLKLYPNPTFGLLNIIYQDEDGKPDPAVIYRMDGKKVSAYIFSPGENNIIDLDLPAGIYLLSIYTEDGQQQSRIVIR
jgi:hypothetical protein